MIVCVLHWMHDSVVYFAVDINSEVLYDTAGSKERTVCNAKWCELLFKWASSSHAWRVWLRHVKLNTTLEWCNFFRISWLVSTVAVYTRSFSFWSIASIEPTLPTPPPVSEMAVKSMGTNEIKLLGGSEEQMIFLWLITHCKRIRAGHITSESISLPRRVSSGCD